MNAHDHPIPLMTDPMSRHWDQPDRDRVLVDATHALVDAQTFEELPEYSTTIPTGVYEGKMWKRQKALRCYLMWFGPSPHPDKCSINARLLLVVDGSAS